jgi:hypothetical protein
MSIQKKRRTNGQITIFIILGLVLLFAAIFVFQLAEKVQVSGLEEAKEDVISKTFGKEGLRLYIEKCLDTALEDGLVKLGLQGGRIWGDAGERDAFVEGETGITYLGEEVGYALTNKKYPSDNQYPCEEGEPPVFCEYKYPNSSILLYPIKFGGRELDIRTIERNLKKFLVAETIDCVEEDLHNEGLPPGVAISTENLEVNLDILSSGIKVEVNYPLTLSLGGDKFFHLAEFDFFYDSSFKKLLEAAVTYPLNLDWSFVDFDYSKKSLMSPTFITGEDTEEEKSFPMKMQGYAELGVEFGKEEVLANGDDLFTFNVGEGILDEGEPYLFRFVRQNRPPALDYVERYSCSKDGYDYLVIPGMADGMENVDITLFALDPDEDTNIQYSVDDSQLPGVFDNDNFMVSQPVAGRYNITAIAYDSYLFDKQVVRILVDRNMKTDVSLSMPYKVYHQGELVDYDDLFSENYRVSNEDPVFIQASWPNDSLTSDKPTAITLDYASRSFPEEVFNFILPEPLVLTESGGCFSLPWLRSTSCSIEDYENDLVDWKDNLGPEDHFREITNNGLLEITFEITYCGENEQKDSKEVDVEVKECVPHRNFTHPWAFPYHKYKYGLDEDGTTDFDNFLGEVREEEVNPFLATHSCCRPLDWNLRSTDYPCFEDPVAGCYGSAKLPDGSIDLRRKAGFILEERKRYCDGNRGNICEGEWGHTVGTKEYPDQAICGNYSENPECSSSIPLDCRGKSAWSVIENKGWCYGDDPVDSGCENLCEEEIVYEFAGSDPSGIFINTVNGFKCGCELIDEWKLCDDNFDGFFDKICRGGRCV